jgi:hypothetical protein
MTRKIIALLWHVATKTAAAAAPGSSDLLSLASLAKDFGDICKVLGPYTPLPIVKPDAFCISAGFSTDTKMCVLLDMVEKGLMESSWRFQTRHLAGPAMLPSRPYHQTPQ